MGKGSSGCREICSDCYKCVYEIGREIKNTLFPLE